jgi:hypothetical protein
MTDKKTNHGGNGAAFSAIQAKLTELGHAPGPPGGHTYWKKMLDRLRFAFTPEERLDICRALRDETDLPRAAGFFLVAWAIETIAEDRIEASKESGALKDISDQMDEILRRHGLETEEDLPLDKAPMDFLALDDRYERTTQQITYDCYLDLGEAEIGNLFMTNYDEFSRLREAGRQYFLGPVQFPQGD